MDSLRAVAPGVLQTCNVSRDMTPKSSLLLLTVREVRANVLISSKGLDVVCGSHNSRVSGLKNLFVLCVVG